MSGILKWIDAFGYVYSMFAVSVGFRKSAKSQPSKGFVYIHLGKVFCPNTERFWNLLHQFG